MTREEIKQANQRKKEERDKKILADHKRLTSIYKKSNPKNYKMIVKFELEEKYKLCLTTLYSIVK